MTDRVCPICHNGWEQLPGEDDVRECRACGGSGVLGPVIPREAKFGPNEWSEPSPREVLTEQLADSLRVVGFAVTVDGETVTVTMPK